MLELITAAGVTVVSSVQQACSNSHLQLSMACCLNSLLLRTIKALPTSSIFLGSS